MREQTHTKHTESSTLEHPLAPESTRVQSLQPRCSRFQSTETDYGGGSINYSSTYTTMHMTKPTLLLLVLLLLLCEMPHISYEVNTRQSARTEHSKQSTYRTGSKLIKLGLLPAEFQTFYFGTLVSCQEPHNNNTC